MAVRSHDPYDIMIIDSNAWVDFFNGVQTPHVQRLDVALKEEEDLAVIPIIITEVFRDSGPTLASSVLGVFSLPYPSSILLWTATCGRPACSAHLE